MIAQRREPSNVSHRLEVVHRRTAGAAHDLKNLLQLIAGSADLVADALNPADANYRFVQEIQRSTERATSLVQQVLSWEQGADAETAIIDVNAVLTSLSTALQSWESRGVRIEFVPGRDLWPVRVDEERFYQMVLNLVVNSMDAMPNGGSLRIETINRGSPDATTTMATSNCTERVEVAIIDTGVGMSEETIRRACDPFFTTKAPEVGTGLGLSMVAEFVSASSGYLSLRSAPGAGTTVIMTLPRAVPVAAASSMERAA